MSKKESKRSLVWETINENHFLFFLSRLLFTASIGLALLFIFSVLNYTREDPNQSSRLLSLLALYAASLIGGLSVASSSLPFYLSGLIGGALWLFTLTGISLFLPDTLSTGTGAFLSVVLHLLTVIIFLLGAYAGHLVTSAGHSRKRRRKHH